MASNNNIEHEIQCVIEQHQPLKANEPYSSSTTSSFKTNQHDQHSIVINSCCYCNSCKNNSQTCTNIHCSTDGATEHYHQSRSYKDHDGDSVSLNKQENTITATTAAANLTTTHTQQQQQQQHLAWSSNRHHVQDKLNGNIDHDVKYRTAPIINNNINSSYGYYSSCSQNNVEENDNRNHSTIDSSIVLEKHSNTKQKRLQQQNRRREQHKQRIQQKSSNNLNPIIHSSNDSNDDQFVNELSSWSNGNLSSELNKSDTRTKHQRMTANSNPELFHKDSSSNGDNTGADEDADRTRRSRSRNQATTIHHHNQYTRSSTSHQQQRMTNVTIIPKHNNIDNNSSIMNLRNRPLKVAATAGNDSNSNPPANSQSISASTLINNAGVPAQAPSSSSITTNKNSSIRRRSKRHQRTKQLSPSAELPQQEQSDCLPVSTRSIRSYFPLRTIGAVCELFRSQLGPQFETTRDNCGPSHDSSEQPTETNTSNKNKRTDNGKHCEPDLALLSIVIGIIETSLTRGLFEDDNGNNNSDMTKVHSDSTNNTATNNDDLKKNDSIDHVDHHSTTNNIQRQQNSAGSYSPAEATPAPIVSVSNVIHTPLDIPIPTVFYENVETLLKKFSTHIKESIDLSKYPKNKTSRELIKKISEVIWSNLHRSHYKDRAHLQTIYNYMTENKLDCYGVAYTVLAACQILGLDDVRLVMSEDHAWVIFGEGETCEVTWHGKCGNDDRCGQAIPENLNCWLYLNGNSMICDRFLTVATLVSAMNLSINATQDSEELAILQQQLLWILYDYGYLQKYPMALGNLADLEDVCVHGVSRKHPIEIFHEAIESAKKYYNDYHVYPYTYIGGYYFRNGRFKEAFKSWADAAQVIKKYNYTRDDEEIYKEFQEIANDLIPNIVKYSCNNESSVLYDPECFVFLLRFYDGLCAWEEDSSTPVLHIGWTKPIVSTISKFPYSTRSQVAIKVNYHLNEKMSHISDNEDDDSENNGGTRERRRRRAASASSTTMPTTNGPFEKISDNGNLSKEKILENGKSSSMDTNDQEMNGKQMKKKASSSSAVKKNCDSDVDDANVGGEDDLDNKNKSIYAILTSKKFAGIKNLLTADKLNTSAIQLQLTAQSQVNINKRSRNAVGSKTSGLFSELDFVSTTTTTLMRTNGTTGTNNSNNNNNNNSQNHQNNPKRFRRE